MVTRSAPLVVIRTIILLLVLLGVEQSLGAKASIGDLCPSAKSASWFHPGVAPRYHAESGWSVYSTRDIAAGEVVLRVPLREAVFGKTFKCVGEERCRAVERVREALDRVSNDADEVALATYLALARESPYPGAVLQIARETRIQIPQEILQSVIAQLVPELATRYDTLDTLIRTAQKILAGSGITLSLSDLHDAAFAVTSRAFYSKLDNSSSARTVMMVPCADLFNHEEGSATVKYLVEDGDLVFRSLRVYSKNQELKINYGDKSAEDLLFQYGFFLPESDKNAVSVSFADTSRWVGGSHPVKQFLVNQMTKKGRVKLYSSGLPSDTLGLLRVLALPSSELSSYTMANILGRHLDSGSPQSETDAALMLESIVYDELIKYKQVFDDNENIMQYMPQIVHDFLITNLRILAGIWKRTQVA